MASAVTLTYAFLAVLPPAIVFFLAYGRYDGTFRDNVVFLYFMGGLLMGGFLGFMTILAFSAQNALIAVILLALLYPISIIIGINRRKWQGERHAVFNGGAMGLGVSLMLGFTLLFVLFKDIGWNSLGQAVTLSTSLAGLFFGMGLLAGNGVRVRRPLRVAFLGTAVLLAPVIFLEEFVRSYTWLWLVLLLAYAAVLGIGAERRVLIEGVADEARKQRRRKRRASRGEP